MIFQEVWKAGKVLFLTKIKAEGQRSFVIKLNIISDFGARDRVDEGRRRQVHERPEGRPAENPAPLPPAQDWAAGGGQDGGNAKGTYFTDIQGYIDTMVLRDVCFGKG